MPHLFQPHDSLYETQKRTLIDVYHIPSELFTSLENADREFGKLMQEKGPCFPTLIRDLHDLLTSRSKSKAEKISKLDVLIDEELSLPFDAVSESVEIQEAFKALNNCAILLARQAKVSVQNGPELGF